MTKVIGVGYTSATLASKQGKTFAVVLEDIANPGKGVRIDKLFEGTTIKDGGSWAGCDQIVRWDKTAGKWAKYAFYKKARTSDIPAWKRCDYETSLTTFVDLTDDDVIQPGETFIYNHNTSGSLTLTLSGQVKAFEKSTTFTLESKQGQFIAYPWPVEIKISDLANLATWTGLKDGGSWAGCDQIVRWDSVAGKWAKYAYYKKARTSDTPMWKRCDYETSLTTFVDLTDDDKLGAGEGFIYNHNTSGTLSIEFKPLEAAK